MWTILQLIVPVKKVRNYSFARMGDRILDWLDSSTFKYSITYSAKWNMILSGNPQASPGIDTP